MPCSCSLLVPVIAEPFLSQGSEMTVTPVRLADVRANWRLDREDSAPLEIMVAFIACAAAVSATAMVAVTVTDAA